jgi:PPM family protein phosphatase
MRKDGSLGLELTQQSQHENGPSEAGPSLLVAAMTHVGRRREHNEDAIAVGAWLNPVEPMGRPHMARLDLRAGAVLTLADGIGGAPCGDEASRFVAMRARGLLHGRYPGEGDLHRAFGVLNDELYGLMDARPWCRTMGTTAVIVWMTSDILVIGSIGDSRFYWLEGGTARQITTDHAPAGPHPKDTPPHRRSGLITQALGGRRISFSPDPDLHTLVAAPGGRFLICSDGLTNMLRPSELDAIVAEFALAPLEQLTQGLIDRALEEGGTDNISVIVASVEAKARL